MWIEHPEAVLHFLESVFPWSWRSKNQPHGRHFPPHPSPGKPAFVRLEGPAMLLAWILC
jgi:hypothetical protein